MMANWHSHACPTVLLLAVFRLAVNLVNRAPAIVPEPPKMQQLAAKLDALGTLRGDDRLALGGLVDPQCRR